MKFLRYWLRYTKQNSRPVAFLTVQQLIFPDLNNLKPHSPIAPHQYGLIKSRRSEPKTPNTKGEKHIVSLTPWSMQAPFFCHSTCFSHQPRVKSVMTFTDYDTVPVRHTTSALFPKIEIIKAWTIQSPFSLMIE